jgi:hypothetical protein
MLFNTLSEVLDQVEKDLIKDQVVLIEDFREEYSFGGIRYNEVSCIHKEIETIKGKKTRKYYHIIISRLDSGRYELVSYAS